MKAFESAGIAALRAFGASVGEIEELSYDGRLEAYINGEDPNSWFDYFWHFIATFKATGWQIYKKAVMK